MKVAIVFAARWSLHNLSFSNPKDDLGGGHRMTVSRKIKSQTGSNPSHSSKTTVHEGLVRHASNAHVLMWLRLATNEWEI